jgi:uncharacterized protein (TIGR03435 family)
MRFSLLLIGPLVVCSAIRDVSPEQAPAPSAALRVYEVVSIKLSSPDLDGGKTQSLPSGFRDINTTLEVLVKDAYDSINGTQIVPIKEIVGMPAWAKSEHYDVEAKVDADIAGEWKNLSNVERWKQEQPMLQAMLADRCKLKVHFETKEMPVYDLLIAKGGLKMKEAAPDEKYTGQFSDGELVGHAMPIENLVFAIPADGRLIIDKTGLGGKRFDFDLKWTPENRQVDGDSGPSLFTALEEQLGLKLVSSKAPGRVLVVDHMEKPSPN